MAARAIDRAYHRIYPLWRIYPLDDSLELIRCTTYNRRPYTYTFMSVKKVRWGDGWRQRNAPQRSKPPLSVDYVRCGARLHISVAKIRCVIALDRSVGRYMPLDPFNVSVKIRWSRRTAEAPAFAQRILTDKLNGSKSIYRPTDLLGRRVSCNGSFQRIKSTSTDIKSTDIKFYAKKPSSFRDLNGYIKRI